jgi:hypothetical protein
MGCNDSRLNTVLLQILNGKVSSISLNNPSGVH